MSKLYIVALFHFKENHLTDALELLEKLVTETRKEDGCLQYDLIEESENKGVFFLMELWESEAHHREHNASEHLADFRKAAAPLFESSAEVYRGAKLF
ncbi:putative quinol monooxygenase [Kaistella rhinocerotis]|uniref:putative quinol monooxygenase n=1 Tax=Kaistella rhinocerotis TaxID=3026437 RepID=UPI00255687D6|nr:putative quinol monooxygenase [Kaistella sp. Ran72]